MHEYIKNGSTESANGSISSMPTEEVLKCLEAAHRAIHVVKVLNSYQAISLTVEDLMPFDAANKVITAQISAHKAALEPENG